jgi:hypothetical protein
MKKHVKLPTNLNPVSELPKDIEPLSEVRTAIRQIESGQGRSHHDAKAELRKRFGN